MALPIPRDAPVTTAIFSSNILHLTPFDRHFSSAMASSKEDTLYTVAFGAIFLIKPASVFPGPISTKVIHTVFKHLSRYFCCQRTEE